MEELKKQDEPYVNKLTKQGSITKWIESFKLHLNAIVGVQMCTLTYVLNNQDVVDKPRPDMKQYQTHRKEYESIEADLAKLMSYDHTLFRIKNNNVFDSMERALSGTNYASTITRYHRERDGRSAMETLVSQNAGKQ